MQCFLNFYTFSKGKCFHRFKPLLIFAKEDQMYKYLLLWKQETFIIFLLKKKNSFVFSMNKLEINRIKQHVLITLVICVNIIERLQLFNYGKIFSFQIKKKIKK